MSRIFIFSLLFLCLATTLFSQNTKKILNHTDYDNWKVLDNYNISNDGNWISFEINPQKGDGWLFIKSPDKNIFDSIPRGYKTKFSPNSDFCVFKIKPQADTTRKAKLKKKKGDDLPKDTLGIFILKKDTLLKFGRVKSFAVPEENQSWVAFLYEKKIETPTKDTTSSNQDTTKIKKQNNNQDTTKTKKQPPKKDKSKKKKKQEGTDFVIFNPTSHESYKFEFITDFNISKNGNLITFIKLKADSIDSAFVYTFNTQTRTTNKIYENKGIAKKIISDNSGTQCAFIQSQDTSENKSFSLFFWNSKLKDAFKIVDTLTKEIPKNWTVSEHGNIYFSDDDSKLYFGTAHKPIIAPKDTLLDEEKSKVDIWSWKDHRLQSQQIIGLDKDKKKSYIAVYLVSKKSIVQIADTIIDRISFIQKGNADISLAASTFPYDIINTWNGDYKDYYLIDLISGNKKLIAQNKKCAMSLSPSGNYIFWFDIDSTWYIQNIKSGKKVLLNKGMSEHFYDEEFDQPDIPDSYGIAGWTENDKFILIYDRYDIWQFDPEGKNKPKNITKHFGRKNNIYLKYISLDKEALFIDSKSDMLLKAFNELSKQEGFYTININNDSLKKLIVDNYDLSNPTKAKESDKLIWTKGSFKEYPDLHYSDLSFKSIKKISNTNPQISNYNWGTVELVKWMSYTGEQLQGLVYKPENIDTTKMYPMIVYFYEKNSDTYNQHYSPKPSRSVINFPLYVSNGYIIFIPDINYKTGTPGKDCYNAIISGTEYMLNRKYIDRKKVGIQGQSWGGYQVAYLVTQTNIYRAAMAGAPVSNMTSAYGGIRWESGSSRMSQYEKGQSRIGVTLWENPLLYIENSPLFYADRVQTPLLIMSNDNDGAVPWQQGIEYFTALRRLQKPVWMLNYNGDAHNLLNRPNCVDLSIRMMQFFDHFLKDKPAPYWMEYGIPAIDKEFKKGYELSK